MIELVIGDRCIECNACVETCPTNVFDSRPRQPPAIARQDDCQTCFMCELYCPADALYVAADCEHSCPVSEADIIASGWVGQFRRDSGWGEWSGDPRFANEHWRMEQVFARARAMASSR
jgi:NAD-dependent dihydropyrimidine dehydrogenase PreA subunit